MSAYINTNRCYSVVLPPLVCGASFANRIITWEEDSSGRAIIIRGRWATYHCGDQQAGIVRWDLRLVSFATGQRWERRREQSSHGNRERMAFCSCGLCLYGTTIALIVERLIVHHSSWFIYDRYVDLNYINSAFHPMDNTVFIMSAWLDVVNIGLCWNVYLFLIVKNTSVVFIVEFSERLNIHMWIKSFF